MGWSALIAVGLAGCGGSSSSPATAVTTVTTTDNTQQTTGGTALTTGMAATLVLGQLDLTLGTLPTAVNASTMFPAGPAVQANNMLFVADNDSAISVSRVLGFPLPLTNGESATLVLGKANLTTNPSSQASAKDFGAVAVSTDGTRLAVSDQTNSRVLLFSTIPTTSYASADLVLGQTLMTTFGTNCSPTSMNGPRHLQLTSSKLIVADGGNNRVLIWNTIPTSNGQPADLVVGQPNLTTCIIVPIGTATLGSPTGVWTDGTKLVVTDSNASRVLIWNTFPTMSGQAADVELGQLDFFHAGANPTVNASLVSTVPSVGSDGTRLAVVDSNNNRVLVWNTFPTMSGQAADVVLGQSSTTANVAGTTATGMKNPGAVSFIGTHLFVTDGLNRRLLMF